MAEYTLNHNSYTKEELISLAHSQLVQSIPPWEKAIYQFILEWFDQGPFIIAHTSGSTGKPKEIRLEKSRMIASAQATINHLSLKKGDKALLCLPIQYIAGKMMVVRALSQGLHLIWVKAGTQGILSGQQEKVDFAAMVPQQLLASLPDLHKVAKLIVGGGPVPTPILDQLGNLSTTIYHTYGMTETLTHIAMRKINKESYEEVFHVLDGVHLSRDERGCMVIEAPAIVDGPVITNDLVELTSPGSFRWLGRHDFVINSGGIKIIPEELEKLLEDDIPSRFFLSAIPHDQLGQQMVLVIEGSKLSENVIANAFQSLKEKKGPYHIPKKVLYLSSFLETESGKIIRKASLEAALSS